MIGLVIIKLEYDISIKHIFKNCIKKTPCNCNYMRECYRLASA
jgi:hypothetical protein